MCLQNIKNMLTMVQQDTDSPLFFFFLLFCPLFSSCNFLLSCLQILEIPDDWPRCCSCRPQEEQCSPTGEEGWCSQHPAREVYPYKGPFQHGLKYTHHVMVSLLVISYVIFTFTYVYPLSINVSQLQKYLLCAERPSFSLPTGKWIKK